MDTNEQASYMADTTERQKLEQALKERQLYLWQDPT